MVLCFTWSSQGKIELNGAHLGKPLSDFGVSNSFVLFISIGVDVAYASDLEFFGLCRVVFV